jgi:hypothetical protein
MIYTRWSARSVLMSLLAVPLGCSGAGQVNIGDTQSLGAKLSDYAAQWDGYAEAYTFPPSSSDRVRLVLDAQGNGTIQVGNDPLLPAPTDPNLGYPPGNEDPVPISATYDLAGGVLYPVRVAEVQADRIQIGLNPRDYYAAWCSLQTPFLTLTGYSGHPDVGKVPPLGGQPDAGLVAQYAYTILPGTSGGFSLDATGNNVCTVSINPGDGTASSDQPIDCGKFALGFANVCACTKDSCTSSPALDPGTAPSDYPAELDGALDSSGKSLTGTLLLNGSRITVHLTRK